MSKATLLVVEDDTHLLWGIRDILKLGSYDVLTAENGKQALELLNDEDTPRPDLIVSDIMMPYVDGLEFLQEVRKKEDWITIPFIFLTARGEKSDINKGKKLGVDDYLVKPFDAPDLLVAVDSRLERQRRLNMAKENEVVFVIDDIKRQIITILNHEMRTPLSLIIGYSDMLQSFSLEEMSTEEIRTFLQGVHSGAERLRRLIENFIYLVELNNGDCAKTYEWRSYALDNLSLIIKTAHDQITKDETITQECEIEIESTAPVYGDKDYLTVIVRELLSNAFKFSKKNSTDPVKLKSFVVGDEVCIEVKDTGIGIEEEHLNDIWKIFFQVGREIEEHQGAGSGLTLVKGFVDMHNGRAEIESVFGEGSTFRVYFPIHKEDTPITS